MIDVPNALTRALSKTFTKTRLAAVQDQFDLMLRYASVDSGRRLVILRRISEKKVEGIGLYIEDGGYMYAEVSLVIDWARHNWLVNAVGSVFETRRPGWEDGVCPEVSVAANRIANAAKEMNKRIRVWIRFTEDVRRDPPEYRSLCDELGFSYGSSAPSWKDGYVTMGGECPDLPELSAILKNAR